MGAFGEVVQDVRAILRSPRGPSSKFITYFQLLDAFQVPGCPVCTLLEQGERKALDALLYEQVNDPFTRDRLVESHGFCNWHAWMLPGVHNSASGVALIYRHLLSETLEQVAATLREVRPRSRWQRIKARLFGSREEPLLLLAWRKKKRRCYLCAFSRRTETDYLTTILEFLGEADFAEAFGRSAGLCLPHLCLAAALGRDDQNLRSLLAAQEARWRDLTWELGEFVRKFDYRYAGEARGRENSSWQRVLEVLVGRAAVFGPEREALLTPPDASVLARASESPQAPETVGMPGETEQLRFENDRLNRRVEDLLAWQEEDRRTRLALEFQILKLTADLKAHIAAPQPEAGEQMPSAPAEGANPD
jgi:hypothetical protein